MRKFITSLAASLSAVSVAGVVTISDLNVSADRADYVTGPQSNLLVSAIQPADTNGWNVAAFENWLLASATNGWQVGNTYTVYDSGDTNIFYTGSDGVLKAWEVSYVPVTNYECTVYTEEPSLVGQKWYYQTVSEGAITYTNAAYATYFLIFFEGSWFFQHPGLTLFTSLYGADAEVLDDFHEAGSPSVSLTLNRGVEYIATTNLLHTFALQSWVSDNFIPDTDGAASRLTVDDTLTLSTNYVVTGAEPVGSTYWNQAKRCYTTRTGTDSYYDHGQEDRYNVKAVGAISNGDLVQFNGWQGDHYTAKVVVPAEVNAFPRLLMGFATEDIADGEYGAIVPWGEVTRNTTGWSVDDKIYYDPVTGQCTNAVPAAPYPSVELAAVVKEETSPAAANGILLVRITFNGTLEDLSNVNGTPASDGSLLVYDGTKWDATRNINDYGTLVQVESNSVMGALNSAAIALKVPYTGATGDITTTHSIIADRFAVNPEGNSDYFEVIADGDSFKSITMLNEEGGIVANHDLTAGAFFNSANSKFVVLADDNNAYADAGLIAGDGVTLSYFYYDGYSLYINGNSYFDGDADITGNLALGTIADVEAAISAIPNIPAGGCTDLGTGTLITGETITYRAAPTSSYVLAVTNTAPVYTYSMMVISTNSYTVAANITDALPITPGATNVFVFSRFDTNDTWHVFGRAL